MSHVCCLLYIISSFPSFLPRNLNSSSVAKKLTNIHNMKSDLTGQCMPDFSITGDTVIKGEIFYEKEVIHGLKIMMLFIPHTFTHYACIPTHPFPSSPNSQQRAFMTNSFTNCGLYTSFPTIKSNKCSCVLYIKKLTNANKTILAVNKMITFLFLLLFSFN